MEIIRTHILGFPRTGRQHELTIALARYRRGECDVGALKEVARELRRQHWELQREAGLDLVSVGDFALHDHVLNHIQMFSCEPNRFGFTERDTELARHFVMARGVPADAGSNRQALERAQWFDTDYQYSVPEFGSRTKFRLAAHRLVSEVAEAQALGHVVKPVVLGPVTFLWLGRSNEEGVDRLELLEALLPRYVELLLLLKARGVEWVQIDEPVLGIDLPVVWRRAVERSFHHLQAARLKLMLATYLSPLQNNIDTVCKLPIDALHIDAMSAPQELRVILDWIQVGMELSIGIIDGRTAGRSNLDSILETLRFAQERHSGQLWIAPSCSLLHMPLSMVDETDVDVGMRDGFSGAVERLKELSLLKNAWNNGEASASL